MTPSELTTLKNGINAETDPTFVAYRTAGSTGQMAEWLSAAHASAKAWNRVASWSDVGNAIDYAKYTPTPANMPTDTPGLCRLVGILIKLTAQQNMILCSGSSAQFDAADTGNVDGLLDTVTAIQSGANGNGVQPGGGQGVNVATALTRPALRAEVIFGGSDITKGTVTAKILTREGGVSDADVVAAINS